MRIVAASTGRSTAAATVEKCVHVADVEADPNPLGRIAAFTEFQKDIAERCEPGEGPDAQQATIVGSYRFLADTPTV